MTKLRLWVRRDLSVTRSEEEGAISLELEVDEKSRLARCAEGCEYIIREVGES